MIQSVQLTPTTFPTKEEVVLAEQKGDVYNVIRWNVLLGPPKNSHEKEVQKTIKEIYARMKAKHIKS